MFYVLGLKAEGQNLYMYLHVSYLGKVPWHQSPPVMGFRALLLSFTNWQLIFHSLCADIAGFWLFLLFATWFIHSLVSKPALLFSLVAGRRTGCQCPGSDKYQWDGSVLVRWMQRTCLSDVTFCLPCFSVTEFLFVKLVCSN